MKTSSYQNLLQDELKDPDFAAKYLTASMDEGSLSEFLLALRNVAEAHGGLGVISEITELNRQSMYKMLSEDGNPTLSSLVSLLGAMGINISFTVSEKEAA